VNGEKKKMAKKEIKINGKLTEAQVKKMASKAAFEDPKVVKAEVEEIADQRLNHNRQNKWQAMKQYFEAFILLKHMGYKKSDYAYMVEQLKSNVTKAPDAEEEPTPETIFSESLKDENGLPISLARLQHIDFEQHVAIRLHRTLVKELLDDLKKDFDITDKDVQEAWQKMFLEKVEE
jgi:hypothetical protein